VTAPPSHRRTWPDASATGEWVREDIPGQRAPSRAATGEITGEWPTGMWERRATIEAPVERPAPAGAAAMPRLLAAVRPDGRPVSLAEHRAAYGPLNSAGAGRVITESGLRGRGGAGFPVEAKVRAVRAVRGKAVVVVNGAAGDPLGEKDAFLISRLPHLILDGAQVAADAVEARQVMV
jgi:respiratory-subunit NADH dehydrogenase subunit